MSKENNEQTENKKEKKSEMEVIQGLLQMISFMAGAINLEAANVLCQLGHCEELIQGDCPICVEVPEEVKEWYTCKCVTVKVALI